MKSIIRASDNVRKQEIYVSTDIETGGPVPGLHPMLSIASAAYFPNGKLIDTFSRNLAEVEGTAYEASTLDFWRKNPAAWDACRLQPCDPAFATQEYFLWLSTLPGRPVCVCYPAGFDFPFINWYLHKFCGKSPFGFNCIDVKTLAMAVLNKYYRRSTKSGWPKAWSSPSLKHTHVALDDALEQGASFFAIRKALDDLHDAAWRYADLSK